MMYVIKYESVSDTGERFSGEFITESESESDYDVDSRVPLNHVVTSFKKEKVKRKPPTKIQLMSFTGQVQSLFESGQKEEEVFELLSADEDIFVRSMSIEILSTIRSGESISLALEKSNLWIIPEYYNSAIYGGEQSNNLSNTLLYLYEYISDKNTEKSKLQEALMYPLVVVAVAMIVSSYLLIEVVPQISNNYKTLGKELPSITMAIIYISEIIKDFGLYVVVIMTSVIATIKMFYQRSKKIKVKIRNLFSKLPIIGGVLRIGDIYGVLTTTGLLIKQGIQVDIALSIASTGVYFENNRIKIETAIKNIRAGQSVSDNLYKAGILDKKTVGILRSGDFSNKIGDRMLDIAKIEKFNQDKKISMITSVLGPASILLVGMLILFIALGMLMPMFELNDIEF